MRTFQEGSVQASVYDRVKSIIISYNNISKEEDHIAIVLKWNSYPGTFICSYSLPPPKDAEEAQEAEPEERGRPPMVVLPYIAGVNEDIRWVWKKFYMKVAFKLG